MAALDWGLPPATPQVAASDIRSSYAIDEDDILTPISFTRPERWDFDPRQYQWGALHLELVLASLQAAERLLYFDHPWRDAYYRMLPGDFERVYLAGRMVSLLMALLSVGMMFLLARQYAGPQAAFWAALLVAVSPVHVLGSTQIRVDVTMTALLIVSAWLAASRACGVPDTLQSDSGGTAPVAHALVRAASILVSTQGVLPQIRPRSLPPEGSPAHPRPPAPIDAAGLRPYPDARIFLPRDLFCCGLAAGAAIAAKYTAIFLAIPLLLVVLCQRRFALRPATLAAAGALAGFLAGEPYLLVHPLAILRQVSTVLRTSHAIPAAYRIPVPVLLHTQAVNLVRFALGVPAALLALAGLAILLRRRAAADWIPLAMLAGGICSLVPLLWPMLRYQIPLLPLLALAVAVALDRIPPRWRIAAGAAVVVMPLAAGIDQVRFMRAPHPANLMLDAVLRQVPPGTPVARLMPELPPLDRKAYPMGPNPMLDDLGRNPPSWVVMTDLPDRPYPDTTTDLLRAQYRLVAEFHQTPRFPWATLGADGAPHDWKYTHPRMALYRRCSP